VFGIINFYAFVVLLFVGSVYALERGGAPERVTARLYLTGFFLTMALEAPFPKTFYSVDWGVFFSDFLLLTSLIVIALYSDRFWIILAAALQLLGTASHLVKLIDQHVSPLVYAILMESWSYPMMALLISGTFRHSRRRRIWGTDANWSFRVAAHVGK
jgi:hypothetical protein